PGALLARNVERVEIGGWRYRVQDHVLLRAKWRDIQPRPGAADADAGLRHHALRIPHRLVVGDDVVRMHLEHVRLIMIDQLLRLMISALRLLRSSSVRCSCASWSYSGFL